MFIKIKCAQELGIPVGNGGVFQVDAEFNDTIENIKIKASLVYSQIDPLVSRSSSFSQTLKKLTF